MKENKAKFVTHTAIVASLYVALTLTLSFMSYGPVQFRVAEILILLVFIDKKYFLSLVLGCAVSNALGPLGMVDAIVGAAATILAILFILIVKKYMGESKKSLFIASLGPVISNSILVGAELTVLFKEMPFIANALYVAFGEFVVVAVVGVIIFPKLKNAVK